LVESAVGHDWLVAAKPSVTSLQKRGRAMRTIELDASGWKTPLEFYDALLAALGAPEWHGQSINALADTMIWSDETNAVKPPYVVTIRNAAILPAAVRSEIEAARDWLAKSRQEHQLRTGRDVSVTMAIAR
jgi:hypothetical protein